VCLRMSVARLGISLPGKPCHNGDRHPTTEGAGRRREVCMIRGLVTPSITGFATPQDIAHNRKLLALLAIARREHLLDEAQHSAIGDLFSDKSREFVLIDRPKIETLLWLAYRSRQANPLSSKACGKVGVTANLNSSGDACECRDDSTDAALLKPHTAPSSGCSAHLKLPAKLPHQSLNESQP
jgi:hypothetical protein